jgi:fluoroquinolone transport system ATP-binding protein
MIKVKALTYTYPQSKVQTLKGLHFSIAEGEIFGFLGPSGAGKSTCQKILYKTLKDFEGDIQIMGKPVNHWGSEYFQYIGVGFELPNHYEKLTARENLQLFSAFYPYDRLLDIAETLAIVGLQDVIDDRVQSFSKGMKMRLNYVRAILHNPSILFLDEPTAGLDPMNARRILDHIQLLKSQGKTIFITTHNMTTADELCDRVSFIVDGEIVITDQPQRLKLAHGAHRVRVELKNETVMDFPMEGLGQNEQFLSFIRDSEVLRIHTQEATLEKVFLHVTGKTLQE